MTPRHFAIVVAVVMVLCITPLILSDDGADGAIDCGSYNTTDSDSNISTSSYAYSEVLLNNVTLSFFTNNETIYVLNGSHISITTMMNDAIKISQTNGSNLLGLTIGNYIANSTLSGDLTGTGQIDLLLQNDSGSRNISIVSVTNTTVYPESVSVSMSPSNPRVGDTVTFTANVVPSNCSYEPEWIFQYQAYLDDITISSNGRTATAEVTGAGTSHFSVVVGWVLAGGLDHRPVSTQFEFTTLNALSISISGPTSVDVGDSIALTATVNGSTSSSDKTVNWTIRSGSSYIEPAPIQVGNIFTATAIAAGNVTLRATAIEDSRVYRDWTVTIEDDTVYVTSITITGPTSVTVGDTFTLNAVPYPTDATDRSVTWTVLSGEEYLSPAGIGAGNYFTGEAIAPGTVELRATAQDGSGVYADWTVTIEDDTVYVTSITITGPTSVTVGDTFTLNAVPYPTDATDRSVTWTVLSGEEYLSPAGIGAGNYFTGEAIAPGTVELRATAQDGSGVYADWTVTIEDDTVYVTSITITGPTSVTVGDTFTLNAVPYPTDASNRSVTWTVLSGEEYLSPAGIGAGNYFTGEAIAPGTVELRATAQDGSGVYADWTVTIEDDTTGLVTSIVIDGPSSVGVGDTFVLNAIPYPLDASNRSVTWTVLSGEEYLSPAGIGIGNYFTGEAIAPGTVELRATAQDGSGVYADWTVTISEAATVLPTSIDMSGPGTVTPGTSGSIWASVLPTNAVNRGILWEITTGSNLISYDTGSTYRGGVLNFEALYAGTVTITATSTADSSVTATYTLTILANGDDDDNQTISLGGLAGLLGNSLFDGQTDIAGIVIYAIILFAIFLLIREPLPVLIISIPLTLIFTALGIVGTDFMILLIIVAVLGLALLARNIWRD